MTENVRKIVLRPYQQLAVDRSLLRFKTHRSALVTIAVGLGKSHIMSEVAKHFTRVVILQPCLELVKQNHEKLAGAGLNTTMIDSAHKGDWNADYIYTTPQTLSKNLMKCAQPELMIIDECFTKDTLILTPNGYKKISEINVGDKVYNATGIGIVEAVTKRHTNETIKMELSNGQTIEGTKYHPIFTKHGWVKLEDLEIRQTLFGIQDMPGLWDDVSADSTLHREHVRKESLLQCILREQKTTIGGKRATNKEVSLWWERETNTIASETACANAEEQWMGIRSGDSNGLSEGGTQIPNLLQSRHSGPKEKDCNRSRWSVTSDSSKEGARCEEERIVGTVRVESISHNKQRGGCYVYNLQVSGHPSYFAGGVLVHNCNVFYEGAMFKKIFSAWHDCNVLALTATPYHYARKTIFRGGWIWAQTKIESIEKVFGESVLSIDREEGRRMGYSPEIQFKRAPITRCYDEHFANRPVYKFIIDLHLDELKKFLTSLNNGIIFCDSKRHAEAVSEHCGVPTIFGTTPKKQRMQLIEQFNSGQVKFLATVGCLVRGYDRQDLENIIILTNYNNECETEQVIGRLNRGKCTKTCWYNSKLNTAKPVDGKTTEVRIRRI